MRCTTGTLRRFVFGRGAPLFTTFFFFGSRTLKMIMSEMMKSAAAPRKKVARMPKASARRPPRSGPRTPPAVMPDCMVPSEKPSLSLGTEDEIIARQAGQSPAAKPWKARTARSCHSF